MVRQRRGQHKLSGGSTKRGRGETTMRSIGMPLGNFYISMVSNMQNDVKWKHDYKNSSDIYCRHGRLFLIFLFLAEI